MLQTPWLHVRTYANLAILWRASYVMLVVIPLISALWPAVRAGVNEYNLMATRVADRIDILVNALETQRNALEAARASAEESSSIVTLTARLGQLEASVSRLLQDIPPDTIVSPVLPWSWSVSYFAALCVAIGQLVYQARANYRLREMSIEQYVSARVSAFRENPSADKVTEADEMRRRVFNLLGFPVTSVDVHSANTIERITVIEEAAQAEYVAMAAENPIAGIAALLLYWLGVALILVVVGQQCYLVASASGWL